jgi:hypothetical protein
MKRLLLILGLFLMLSCSGYKATTGKAQEIEKPKYEGNLKLIYEDFSKTVYVLEYDSKRFIIFNGVEKGGICQIIEDK